MPSAFHRRAQRDGSRHHDVRQSFDGTGASHARLTTVTWRCVPMVPSARVCIPSGLRPARSCICPPRRAVKTGAFRVVNTCLGVNPDLAMAAARGEWVGRFVSRASVRASGLQRDALSF
jgi:hypothetical protein